MPKSKTRKNHRKKVQARNKRITEQREAFNRKFQQMFQSEMRSMMSANTTDTEKLEENQQ